MIAESIINQFKIRVSVHDLATEVPFKEAVIEASVINLGGGGVVILTYQEIAGSGIVQLVINLR